MLAHAYAPSKAPAPLLYAHYTWVKELGVTWADLGGITTEEIYLLAEMITIQAEAMALKGRVQSSGRV